MKAFLGPALAIQCATAAAAPNFVFILCDNLGNGDVACFHPQTKHRTPHLDRMAAEGRRFTSFYAASGVCTPSRAALMTGCYAQRIGLHAGGTSLVLRPVDAKGLHPGEETIAEVLKKAGYATAIVGKWHLGDQPEFLPTRQGFDSFFGIPYSDDMVKEKFPDTWPELPLMRDERVVEAPADRATLTQRYTEEAIRFLEANRERPFFLYLAHAMPGSTTDPFASARFEGRSANGHYGDSVEEIDWSTGEILAALARLRLDEKTLVVWTADNGAVRRDPPQGSNAPYQGYMNGIAEGGMRVPCIARWPGKIPAGTVSDELCTMMDVLPTFAKLAGAPLPARKIDGRDMSGLLLGEPGAASSYDETGFFYYHLDQLQAVRAGEWKLYLPLEKRLGPARKNVVGKTELFDVRHDFAEARELSAEHPDVVRRMKAMAEAAREEIGDFGKPGHGQRPAGMVENPRPQLLR